MIVFDVDDFVLNGWKGSCGYSRGDVVMSDGWLMIVMCGLIVVVSVMSDVIYVIVNVWV